MHALTLFPALPHGPVLELVEADEVPPMHFPVRGGYFQPIIRLHASELEGMHRRLEGIKTMAIHQDLPDDGCGRFFEVVDPDGTWLQYHVNIGEQAIMAGTTEAVVNIEIPVADVCRSAAFYRTIGFSLDREPSDEVAFLSAGFVVDRFGYRGISEFGIILTRRDEYPLMRFARQKKWEPVMVLQTEDTAAYRARLADSGIGISEWHSQVTSGCFLLCDPDGHFLGIRSFSSQTGHEEQARGHLASSFT
jgi:predicted enzyme related to lactoylglutathione lyase